MPNTPDKILAKVCHSFDVTLKQADKRDGLFPSLMDLDSGEMLTHLPPHIEGQRDGDRAPFGSNLLHDETALFTLYALAQALDRPRYAEAADRYLRRFATHCTDTATGLFPWGEHSFWHLTEDRVGDSHREAGGLDRPPGHATHDHLRQAPVWLWEKLYAFNPDCVVRFAEGLEYHWTEGKRDEYIRHAHIEQRTYPGRGDHSADFPRHSGFYVLDSLFAWSKTGRDDLLAQGRTLVDYWPPWRDENGLLLGMTRSQDDDEIFHNVNSLHQTISLAASLLESAEVVESRKPALAAHMREIAGTYVNGFFTAAHDPENGVFVCASRRGSGEIVRTMPVWGSRYGQWPVSYGGLILLCIFRHTRDDRALRWAEGAGNAYLAEPFPSDVAVPSMDAGLAIGLLADLFDLTREARWLDRGLALSDELMTAYLDRNLPRGAAGIDWYESQMGPAFLQHGLARIALLARDPEGCPLGPDYTTR